MTTLTATVNSTRETDRSLPTVPVAGVDWPLHKVQAVVFGLLVAAVVGLGTQSGEVTAWALTIGTAVMWWSRRAAHTRRVVTR